MPSLAAFAATAPLRAAPPPPRRWRPATCMAAAADAAAAAAARDFATQRSMQQAIFTARVLRDETSAAWLDRFCGGGMEDRHVADALRGSDGEKVGSEVFLRRLLSTPAETIIVRKPFAGRGGSTATNPYIKQKFFEYEVEVVPRVLGLRVLEARAAVAGELVEDLRLVGAENERLWRCYRAAVNDGEEVDVTAGRDDPASPALVDRLAYAAVESGTPYREANYDLALSLTLALGARRMVERLGGSREGEWLGAFCAERVGGLLAPPRGLRRAADGFVAQLLAQPPVLREGGVVCDPGWLCERVLEERLAVSRVWIATLQAAKEEHLELERELLEGSL